MAVPILLDCDPGHHDTLAMLLALASPEVELLGITTVAGNQTLAKTTANALRVLEFAGRDDLPVAAGAAGRAPPAGGRRRRGPPGAPGRRGRRRPRRDRPRRARPPAGRGDAGADAR